MKVTWLGHSAFLLEGKDRILVDPYFTGNPAAAVKAADVACDLICVTHAHNDHFGDAVELATRNEAPIVANFEVASVAERRGAPAVGINIGGTTKVGNTRITMTHAIHSSCFVGEGRVEGGGNPGGFVIDSGERIYHAGDTALFSDLALVGELYEPRLALIPIGDFFTMGPREAARAVELLGVERAVPMHYNTFDVIRQDPKVFRAEVARRSAAEVTVLKPGESLTQG